MVENRRSYRFHSIVVARRSIALEPTIDLGVGAGNDPRDIVGGGLGIEEIAGLRRLPSRPAISSMPYVPTWPQPVLTHPRPCVSTAA